MVLADLLIDWWGSATINYPWGINQETELNFIKKYFIWPIRRLLWLSRFLTTKKGYCIVSLENGCLLYDLQRLLFGIGCIM